MNINRSKVGKFTIKRLLGTVVEHWTGKQGIVGSNPAQGNYFEIFFIFSIFSSSLTLSKNFFKAETHSVFDLYVDIKMSATW